MSITLVLYYLSSIILRNVVGDLEHDITRRSILLRRAIDGTRGRKYFDPEEEGSFDSYGSAGGQYDRYEEKQDHSDIRMNVPGEPGIDYPAYTTLPQTGFSCEGRMRGYYADEVAGCQVFHVCHDILVSSFLCPIGSIFNQKLLTCDWWNKVDCSMTRKFIEIKRDDYDQEDDDELIRKAYGMMGLETGMDVTSDELVDPDRGGRIIGGVTIESTGNGLPGYHNHPSRFITGPRFLSDYNDQSGKDRTRTSTSTSYQNSFHNKDYLVRPGPRKDSPIVHIRNIGEGEYREGTGYRYFEDATRDKSAKMINEFQPSYAPTVPTVTTTTRRFYSPTIPTTYRPSTLAYSKIDQVIESSDHLYSHSEQARSSIVAPAAPDTDIDTESEFELDSKISMKQNYNDTNTGDEHPNNYTVQKRIDTSRDRLKNVVDAFNENLSDAHDVDARSSSEANESVIERYSDDIETKASVGLARAFNGSIKLRIHVQDTEDVSGSKDKKEHSSTFIPWNRSNSYITETINVFNLSKSIENSERSVNLRTTETTLPINYGDNGRYPLKDIFKEITSALTEYSSSFSEVEDHPTEIEDNSPSTITSSFDESSTSEKILSETSKEDPISMAKLSIPSDDVESSYSTQDPHVFTNDTYYSTARTDIYSTVFQPDIVLKPPTVTPSNEFRINVPDYPSTTRVPALPSHYTISYKTGVDSSAQFSPDERLSKSRNPPNLAPPFVKDKDMFIEEDGQSSVPETFIDLYKNTHHVDTRQSTSEGYEKEKIVVLLQNNSSSGSSSSSSRNRTNLPYRVSSNVKYDSSSTISPSILQGQKVIKNYVPDRSHQIEIEKSIEEVTNYEPSIGSFLPAPPFATSSETIGHTKSPFIVQPDLSHHHINDTAFSSHEMTDHLRGQNKAETDASNSRNANPLSLLQLMTELFKIDHVPRPFGLNGPQSVKSLLSTEYEHWNNDNIKKENIRKIDKGVPFSLNNDKEVLPTLRDSLDGMITPRNLVKHQKLIELAETVPTKEIDRPLYNIENQHPIYRLPNLQSSFNFKESEKTKNPSGSFATFTSTTKSSIPSTTTTTIQSVKTIVETEFVPSIGFSFDTDEGRRKYIEAVLGGWLYEPIQYRKIEKNESINVEATESSSINQTSTRL